MSVNITNLAQPIAADFKIPVEAVERDFSAYWESIKGTLSPAIVEKAMAGFRELEARNVARILGGKEKLYEPVLLKYTNDNLAESCDGLLVVEKFAMERLGEYYTITATGYRIPEVKWKTPAPTLESIKIDVPNIQDDMVTEETDREIKKVLEQHSSLVKSDQPATKQSIVEIGCISTDTDTGEVWQDGTFSANKLALRDGFMKYGTMRDVLLGTVPDDVVSVKLVIDTRNITATCTVINVFELKDAELNNDLAKSLGFPDKDSMVGSLKTRSYNVIKDQLESARWLQFINAITSAEVVEVGVIPHSWVKNKVASLMANIQSKTGKDGIIPFLKTKFPNREIADMETAMAILGEWSVAELTVDLIVRSWAFNTRTIDGPWSIDHLNVLIDKIKGMVINKSKVN